MNKCILCGRKISKTKISMLIIIIYFISLFLFEFFIGAAGTQETLRIAEEMGELSIGGLFEAQIVAGIWHFRLVLIFAIVCVFIRKIDKTYKRIVYMFPILTFIFSLPVGIIALFVASDFGLFGL